MTQRKKKQSPSRNEDTQFMNKLWRENEERRLKRSQAIRERERLARERYIVSDKSVLGADA